MAVITISITESTDKIIEGIPRFLTVETNMPASVFYTLDGTDPTTYSDIYIDGIILPTDVTSVTVKLYAFDGVDSSAIVTETYSYNRDENMRMAHSGTDTESNESLGILQPFGTNPIQPDAKFTGTQNQGITLNDPNLTQYPTGFDGSGNPGGFTNKPYNTENYQIVYSNTHADGSYGRNVGTLPAEVTVVRETPKPEESSTASKLFDPRAFVIYQDNTKEDLTKPPIINATFNILEDFTKTRDNAAFSSVATESLGASASFVKSFYNPTDNTITYYHYDNIANRWIISKSNYTPAKKVFNMANVVFSARKSGDKFVYEWVPFSRRVLF